MYKYDNRYVMLQVKVLESIKAKQETVSGGARRLGVTRPTIYEWQSRYNRFGIDGLLHRKRKKHTSRPHNKTPEEIEQLVINVAKEYIFDGCETLHDRLEYEYNVTLNPTTIYRILKRKDVRYGEYHVGTKKRWKKQLYAHKKAGKELQMDTKYPFGYKEGKVIYTIIDDASRWVFAWTYSTANKENTIDFLQKVLKRAPFNIKKIRVDNGKEFIANIVKAFLKEQSIQYRNNTPYCPEENGKIERFHKTLNQKALVWGFYPSDSIDNIQYKLNLFLHYYNFRKKHRGLGMNGLTPIQKLHQLKSVNLTLQCYTI